MTGKRQEARGKRFKVYLSPIAFRLAPSFILIIVFFLTTACTQQEQSKPLPFELTREHSCAVCGMIIVDFPGTKGQIHYRNGRSDKFCSTLDMFMFYLQPDRPKNIIDIYVQDMGKADWDHPEGYWIDAEEALYVYGGDIMGPMGDALVPFADLKEAEAYLNDHGGRIVRFHDIKMDMLRPDV
jgi:copper chaperone NosL